MNNEQPIQLDNWSINGMSVYDPPECAILGGECNGERVYPSMPFRDWNPEDQTFRSYFGKLYRLGNPHPEYEAVYPDAKFRFVTSCFGVTLEKD